MILVFSSLLPIVPLAQGQNIIYQTDFHTSSSGFIYTTNSSRFLEYYITNNRTGAVEAWTTSLPGQDGWTANTATNTFGPGVVNFEINFNTPPYNSPYFMSLGGDFYNSTTFGALNTYPTASTTFMTHDANTGLNKIHFDSSFFIGNPNDTTPNDTFGWTLFNIAGNRLMSINFTPVLSGQTVSSYGMTVSSFAANGVQNQQLLLANGNPLENVLNRQFIHFGYDFNNIGTASQSVSVYNYTNYSAGGNGTLLGTTQISGSDFSSTVGGTNVGALAATWTLADQRSTNANINGENVSIYPYYGNNGMNVFNLTIAIPEPKTWILFGISALIMVIALRRKA